MSKQPLTETHPELASQADGWDPSKITSGSGRKLPWICKDGHKWEAAVYSRSARNLGCPICSGQKILAGFNDLATIFPEIAAQALGWDPSTVSRASGQKLLWECSQGHKWEAKVSNRTVKNQGCPTCSDRRVLKGKNDLLTTHPDLAREAIGWNPADFMEGHTSKKSWKCSLGHVWEATVISRTGRNTGCPVCSGKKIVIGFNDLKSNYPAVAQQAYGWDPELVTSKSGKKMSWRCQLGHIWEEVISNRTRKGYGCPVCSNHKVVSGFNDFGTTHPELAKQAHGWDPSKYLAGNNNRFDWVCELGHTWSGTLSGRSSKKTGCPVCANQKVLAGFNDLKSQFPEIAAQANGWNPEEVISGSEVVKEWKCNLGHVWKAQIAERSYKGFGCRICSGRELLIGFNDLATKFPDVAQEAFGWDPSQTLAGHGKKKKWKCQAGHTWDAEVSTRTSAGTGCPSCGKYGFSSAQSGWIYFLEHPVWEMLQIGITNYPDQRLKSHKKIGWEVLEIRGPLDGQLARDWETAMLVMLRNQGADLGNISVSGKFDGASEAWSKSTFLVTSLKQLMDLTNDFEEFSSAKKKRERKKK